MKFFILNLIIISAMFGCQPSDDLISNDDQVSSIDLPDLDTSEEEIPPEQEENFSFDYTLEQIVDGTKN